MKVVIDCHKKEGGIIQRVANLFGWKSFTLSFLVLFSLLQGHSTTKFLNKKQGHEVIFEQVDATITVLQESKSYKACTAKDYNRPRPENVDIQQYEKVKTAMRIVHFIVTELHKVGAPVSLVFGTTLFEYRNGTGPCVLPYFLEDDFDIGVFREHFHYIVLLRGEIEKRFKGWRVIYAYEPIWKDTLLSIMPPKQRSKKGFQVDVYGFAVNQPRDGLVEFRWDNVRVASEAFLPLVKYKPILTSRTTKPNENDTEIVIDDDDPFFYMPFNAHCYLQNLYGEDFMTPQKLKQRDVGDGTGNKFGHPRCERERLSSSQQSELERQMSFLNKTYEGRKAADEIFLEMGKQWR